MDSKPLEGEEEVEPEELLKREVKKDPWEARLKSISKDSKTRGELPAWVIRSYNVKDSFINPQTQKHSENFGVVCVKSLWWPGSFNFYTGERTLQIYMGNGQKHEAQTYYPINPPVMMSERAEIKLWGEPNPTQEYLDYIEAQKAKNDNQQEEDA